MKNAKKILITGATGFIGEHLTQKLINLKFNPTLLSRNPNSLNPKFKHLKFLSIDLQDLPKLKKYLKGYDIVIHLAGRTGAGHLEDPITDFKINALGSLNLYQACADNHVERIISMSSYEVYGPSSQSPINEDAPRRPQTPYAASLSAREMYAEVFSKTRNLKITTFRLFNVYGQPISEKNRKGIIPNLIKRITKEKEITINAHPLIVRDFIYIDDVIGIILRSLNNKKTGVFNVGTGIPTSFQDLARTILSFNINNAKIKFIKNTTKIVESKIYANIWKLKNELKYTPTTTLKDGIKKMLAS